jgi:hypothetical protein
MHGQLGGFEADAEAADVEHTVLNTLKGVEHLHDRARVSFDEFDLVLGLGFDRLLQFGLEEILHQTGIDDRRRMARADTDDNVLGDSVADAAKRQSGRKPKDHRP